MTCSVCPCQKIACRSLGEYVLHRTWNTHHADSITLFLCQTRERDLTASTSMASVTRFGITNSQAKLRLHVRLDFQARILKSSQGIPVEYQMLLKLLRHQCLQTSNLDLIVQLVLHLLLVARHVALPAFDSRSSRREHRPGEMIVQMVSFPSSCRRITSLLEAPPCL